MTLSLRKAAAFACLFVSACAIQSALADEALNALCDAVAASPRDVSRPANVPGVSYSDVDAKVAVPACEASTKADPQNARQIFQYGRALDADGKLDLALENYRKAADEGHVAAANNVGKLLTDGVLAKDFDTAFKYYTISAEHGFDFAMVGLGHLYRDGNGTMQNEVEALKWYSAAADLGDSDGMHEAARLLDHGQTVKHDFERANVLFQKAGELGNGAAMNDYAANVFEGHGVAQDKSRGNELFAKAFELGNSYGAMNRGTNLLTGDGIVIDKEAGFKLFVDGMKAEGSEIATDIIDKKAVFWTDRDQIRIIEDMLKWKGLFKGTPDQAFDDESIAALRTIRDGG